MSYENLYIYYVDAKLSTDRSLLGKSFIGNWQEEDCSFLFFSDPADDLVGNLLAVSGGPVLKDRFVMTYKDWIGGNIHDYSIGDFRISPPWSDAPGKNRILLDPGVVFGSGTHATTRDCVCAMEEIFSRSDVSRTMDLGCGTGLLSLVAARMGSRQTLAVDNNFLSVETARDNILCNGLDDRVLAVQGRAQDFMEIEADLLVANIHYDVMKELVSCPGFREKKKFVFSGLFHTQARLIEDILRQHGAKIEYQMVGEGVWHTLAGSC
jgi:ribosomal protein L11 methyltransferase